MISRQIQWIAIKDVGQSRFVPTISFIELESLEIRCRNIVLTDGCISMFQSLVSFFIHRFVLSNVYSTNKSFVHFRVNFKSWIRSRMSQGFQNRIFLSMFKVRSQWKWNVHRPIHNKITIRSLFPRFSTMSVFREAGIWNFIYFCTSIFCWNLMNENWNKTIFPG